MNKNKVRKYINKVKWKEAKTYKKTFPHEYTIREWDKELEEEFEKVVMYIREAGREESFFGQRYIYLYGYKYWSMSDPLNITRV